MSYQFHATCGCGYQSDVLFENTCVCQNCRDLVDVPRLPFRYQLMPCPKCQSPKFEGDMLLNLLGNGWLDFRKQSALTCPKCENAKVQFHLDAHVSLVRGITFPAVGDEVDGHIEKNGQLDIPWFSLDAAKIHHNIPTGLAAGQRITMKVTSITTAKPIDAVQSMFYRRVVTDLGLQYLNLLSENRR